MESIFLRPLADSHPSWDTDAFSIIISLGVDHLLQKKIKISVDPVTWLRQRFEFTETKTSISMKRKM